MTIFKRLIHLINCYVFDKHEEEEYIDGENFNIKYCKHCDSYKVHHKGLDMVYRCTWDRLPPSYRY